MRYIFETQDNEGLIGIQISKWQKEGKITIIEKGEPAVEIQAQLERVARALDVLKKSGYNSKVMKSWIKQETKLSNDKITAILSSQEDFFKQIGVLSK